MVGTSLVHLVLYCGINGFFLSCDYLHYLQQYKLDRTEAMAYTPEQLKDTLVQAAIGQFVTNPIALYPTCKIFQYFGSPSITAELPSLIQLFLFFWLC